MKKKTISKGILTTALCAVMAFGTIGTAGQEMYIEMMEAI